MSARLMVGTMSGTSADGVDVALVAVRGSGESARAELLGHSTESYDDQLKALIFTCREHSAVSLSQLADLGRDISFAYARAVCKLLSRKNVSKREIAAIAAHGQTLYHAPPHTIQWIDPALLAAQTGCAVISDFRRADCAAGGQGAPLVPFADYILFRHPRRSRALLNIGGIANLTYLPAGAGIDDLSAFDTGPGNCISDSLSREIEPHGLGYDESGARAASAMAHPGLAEAFLADPYFRQSPPKSTDGPAMIYAYRAARVKAGCPDAAFHTQLSTAAFLTARTIMNAIIQSCRPIPDELIISGGGTANRAIMNHLREMAAAAGLANITTTDSHGVPSAAKEAIAFALLGSATLDGLPANVPAATGARRRAVLGSITPAPICPSVSGPAKIPLGPSSSSDE